MGLLQYTRRGQSDKQLWTLPLHRSLFLLGLYGSQRNCACHYIPWSNKLGHPGQIDLVDRSERTIFKQPYQSTPWYTTQSILLRISAPDSAIPELLKFKFVA